jgi:tRNA threonylcarbamoyl adenosine modification protein YjeE
MTAPSAFAWTLPLPEERDMVVLAEELAPVLAAGDLVTLSGDLGAGKTALARTLIRLITRDPELEVPSPTFTLMQHYDAPDFPIVHADLYRIGDPAELFELGWDEAGEGALVLVEWPERAGPALKPDRLDVALRLAPGGAAGRVATLTGHGAWARRLDRLAAAGEFLRRIGWVDARRSHIQGDASTRSYERLWREGQSAILMNAPPRTDRTAVRWGKTYSEIAHISQDIKPFVALDRGLAERGFSTPRILAQDLERGMLLLEDLGGEGVVDADGPIAARYAAAVDLLAALHRLDLPTTLPVADGVSHTIPPFDLPAMEIEVELMIDWYLPKIGAPPISQRSRDAFFALWRHALLPAVKGQRTWLLRDVHSPNLIWLAGREGVARIGLLDFQDAMIGSPAYDVASLAMDARVSVPEELELQLLARYVKARRAADPGFDPAGFTRDYAVMGAQRLTKILGIFARLERRDGKPAYLRHLPRVRAYLGRALAHPQLAEVRAWFETFVFPHEPEP